MERRRHEEWQRHEVRPKGPLGGRPSEVAMVAMVAMVAASSPMDFPRKDIDHIGDGLETI